MVNTFFIDVSDGGACKAGSCAVGAAYVARKTAHSANASGMNRMRRRFSDEWVTGRPPERVGILHRLARFGTTVSGAETVIQEGTVECHGADQVRHLHPLVVRVRRRD